MRVIWRHVLIVLLAVVLLPAVASALEGTPVVEPEPSTSVAPPTATAAPSPPETPTAIATETPTFTPPEFPPTVAATSTAPTPTATASPETSAPASAPTPSADARASEFTGDLPVSWSICFDPQRAGEVAFEVKVVEIRQAFVGLQDTASTECRSPRAAADPTVFALTNTGTGQTWTLEGSSHVTFADIAWGTYTLAVTSHGRTDISAPFWFAASDDGPTLELYSVVVRTFVAQLDWAPGGTGDDPAQVMIYAYVCEDAARDVGGEFFRYGPSIESASAAVTTRTAICREASPGDFLSFVAQPVQPGAVLIRFWTEDGMQFYLATWPLDVMPAGDYIITEGRSGVSTAPLHFSGWGNSLTFLLYGAPPATEWIMELSSADPAVADVLPAGATWTLSQDGTVRYSGTFWGKEHPLPDDIYLRDPVNNGAYELAVDAGPAFAPYRARVTIRNILPYLPRLSVVLQPSRPTPFPAPTATPAPTSRPDPTSTVGALTPGAVSLPAGSGVIGLPSTGQGGRDRGTMDAGMLVAGAVVLVLAAGLMWHRRTLSR